MGVSIVLDVFGLRRDQLLHVHGLRDPLRLSFRRVSSAVPFFRHPALTRKTLRLPPPV